MEIDFVFVILMAAFAFGPAVTVLIVTTWCKMDQKKDGAKKQKQQTVISVPPKPDTRIVCPKCDLKENRRVIRTYTQKGVAVHRYYKCKCGQPFRQSDYFSDRI